MRIAAETTAGPSEANAEPRFLDRFSDADLLEAWSRDGQRQALATLVQRYSVMVLSVCRRRCRTDADAEDAFQTTFLYLARNSKTIRSPERLPGWLHRVAERAAVATLKSLPRQSEPMVEPPDDPDDPLDRLTQRHEAIVLDEELADLPEHYRSALVMHIYEGRPLHQLAEHFGTTVGSIRGRLQRGKQMLAKRLRHRGVVPVLAFASAQTWSASEASAASASHTLIASIANGPLPTPPIDPALHSSLLSNGFRLMPSLYTTAGVLGGTTALLLLLSNVVTTGESGTAQAQAFTVDAAAANSATAPGTGSTPMVQFGGAAAPASSNSASGPGVAAATADPAAPSAASNPAALAGPAFGPSVWSTQLVEPVPATLTAKQISAALDTNLQAAFLSAIGELPTKLPDEFGIPVMIDDRGIEFAQVGLGDVLEVESTGVPLRAALGIALRDHGLRAVVRDDALMITANPAALVHRGIGTSRWINVEQETAKKLIEQLDQETTREFIEIPLDEAMQTLSAAHEVPMAVDLRALEEIGLSHDQPVSVNGKNTRLKSLLERMLRDLDLTITIQGETLVVTTKEAAENELLRRIYWLEGTGMAAVDSGGIVELINASIQPDTWEALGGPSTISPIRSQRPAILVSTTLAVHREIEALLEALRETHFGDDPELKPVQVPVGGGAGLGGGFGGGGMGGGGMGGGGFF